MECREHVIFDTFLVDVTKNGQNSVVADNEVLVNSENFLSSKRPDRCFRTQYIILVWMPPVVGLQKKALHLPLPTLIGAPDGQKRVLPLLLDLLGWE